MDLAEGSHTMIKRIALALVAFTALSATPRSDLSLHVDLSERFLDVRLNGESIETYAVGIGKPSYPTPTGSFSIRRIIWNPRWVPPRSRWARRKRATAPGDPKNPMKVAKIFFRPPDYYIHGTGEELSIGGDESHGCLRMTREEVEELAKLIMNHGGQPRSDSWYYGVLRTRREAPVRLRIPVPIQISP